MTKYISDSSNFGADGPFFRIIREGLKGLADGEDYFDLLADDVVFEYVISVPGYPRRAEGRQAIIAGDGSRPTGDVETVTGRPPASFEAFARRNAAAWTTPEDT